MRSRSQGVIALLIIGATVLAGVTHASWWAFVAGACGLAIISLLNHDAAYRALGGGPLAQRSLMLSSTLNATATSAAALMIGRGIGWAWGV